MEIVIKRTENGVEVSISTPDSIDKTQVLGMLEQAKFDVLSNNTIEGELVDFTLDEIDFIIDDTGFLKDNGYKVGDTIIIPKSQIEKVNRERDEYRKNKDSETTEGSKTV